jgi:secretion/DNA translocation related TadE-like protein
MTGSARASSARQHGECGSISVILAAGILVALVLVLGVADLGRVLVARSRARTAADAAALAAAQELALPSGRDPSTVAKQYAVANGAELSTCVCVAGTFEATVEVRVPAGDLMLVPGAPMTLARARAVVDIPRGAG